MTPRCRYLRRSGEQCTAEPAEAGADIELCPKHLARAVRLFEDKLREQMGRLT